MIMITNIQEKNHHTKMIVMTIKVINMLVIEVEIKQNSNMMKQQNKAQVQQQNSNMMQRQQSFPNNVNQNMQQNPIQMQQQNSNNAMMSQQQSNPRSLFQKEFPELISFQDLNILNLFL